jgi:hypothetical protein
MYSRQNQNFTPIDSLMDLDDLESDGSQGGHLMKGLQGSDGIGQPTQFHQSGATSGIPDKYQKFIRTGMGPPVHESGMGRYQQQQPEYFAPPPPQKQQETPMRPSYDSPTCLEIADHVGSCPICSRFYKNDNTVYIIAIVILAIICILLLKKVLNL